MDMHLELLQDYKFDKQLQKLNKKLKNKKVLLYGAGVFFEKINENYNLSNLNIVGISDRKYSNEHKGAEFLGYKIISFDEISELDIDYILISTLNTIKIQKSLKEEFKNKKIKIIPLVKKTFFDFLFERLR